jgi:hypothetical protein
MQVSKLTGWCRVLALGVPVALAAPAWAQTTSDTTRGCHAASVEYADEPGLTPEERIARMDRAFTRSLNRYAECQDAEDDRLEPHDRGAAAQAGGTEGSDGSTGASDGQAGGANEAAAGAAGQEPLPTSPGANPSDIQSNTQGDIAGEEGEFVTPGTAGAGGGNAGPADGVSGDDTNDGFGASAPSVAAGGISGDEPDSLPVAPGGIAGTGRESTGTQAGRAGGPEDGAVAGTGPRVLQNGKLPEDIPPADNDSVLEAQIRQAAIDEPDPELKKKLWNEYRRYKGLPQVN